MYNHCYIVNLWSLVFPLIIIYLQICLFHITQPLSVCINKLYLGSGKIINLRPSDMCYHTFIGDNGVPYYTEELEIYSVCSSHVTRRFKHSDFITLYLIYHSHARDSRKSETTSSAWKFWQSRPESWRSSNGRLMSCVKSISRAPCMARSRKILLSSGKNLVFRIFSS